MTIESSLDAVCVCGHYMSEHKLEVGCCHVNEFRQYNPNFCKCVVYDASPSTAHDVPADFSVLEMTRQEIYDMRRAMNTYGGSFVKAIAEAFAVADERNTQRLIEAFPDYVKQYSAMAKIDRNKTS